MATPSHTAKLDDTFTTDSQRADVPPADQLRFCSGCSTARYGRGEDTVFDDRTPLLADRSREGAISVRHWAETLRPIIGRAVGGLRENDRSARTSTNLVYDPASIRRPSLCRIGAGHVRDFARGQRAGAPDQTERMGAPPEPEVRLTQMPFRLPVPAPPSAMLCAQAWQMA